MNEYISVENQTTLIFREIASNELNNVSSACIYVTCACIYATGARIYATGACIYVTVEYI